jgi:hypothetical protein
MREPYFDSRLNLFHFWALFICSASSVPDPICVIAVTQYGLK